MPELRPYQQQAVETLIRLAPAKQFLLLQAATGAGKTIMASKLMQYYTNRWRFRCLFLAHRAILVRQALAHMQTSFEDADFDVDCLCASVERPGHAHGHIIVASPQTLARRLDDLPRVDMMVIDECHRVPPKGQPSLYADVIAAVTAKRPNARVVGITATPWRLGQTFIYGPASRPGHETWWDSLDVRISIAQLQAEGWLAPLVVRACAPQEDLLSVPLGASGDFREDALEQTLLRPLHLGSAVKAVQTEAGDRAHIAAFCVTIAHARALAERFRAAGIAAAAVDSKTDADLNARILRDFAAGRVRVLCSVGMLTEGWDCPEADCLLMCRPTVSPALYVQMVGRGLRIAENKRDCLLLDLSGNVLRHGSPNAPRIETRSGSMPEAFGGGRRGEKDEEQLRHCPFCDAVWAQDPGLNCPQCRAPLYELEEAGRRFQNIDLERLERLMRHGSQVRQAREQAEEQARAEEKARQEEARRQKAEQKAALINQGAPVLVQPVAVSQPEPYQIRNGAAAGAMALKVDLLVQVPGYGRRTIQLILDPEGSMGRKSRQAFWALRDTKDFWARCGKGSCPTTRAGLVARWNTVSFPEALVVRQSMGGWLRVLWKEKGLPGADGDRDEKQK